MHCLGFVSADRCWLRFRRHLAGMLAVTVCLAAVLAAAQATQTEKATGEQLLNYLQSKQLDQAISLGQKAVARWPQNDDFHHWLGIAYFQSGKNSDALAQLAQAEKLRPQDYDIHFDTALVHLQDQKYPLAAEQLQKALRLEPDRP